MAMRRAVPWLTIPLVVFALGCDLGDRGGDAILRTDSAGIEIVSSARPLWNEGEGWRVAPEPNLQIGQREGTEEEMLHGVVSVRAAGDAILVAQQTELRFYGRDGRLARRVGGAGQGPGEFSRVAAALPCGDRIIASELSRPRLTVFDSSGEPRIVPLPTPEQQGLLNPLAPLHACTAAGVVGGLSGRRSPRANPPAVQRQPALLVHLDLADARLDTLLVYPGVENYSGLAVPFGRRTLVAATDSIVYAADTGEPELRALALDGATRRILRFALPVRPVTSEDVDRIHEQYLGGLPQGLLAEIRPRLDAVPIPETMPYFSRLEVAPDGTIWLQAYQRFRDEPMTRWTVVDAAGQWLGGVELPAGFTVHEFGTDDVLGVWRDADGVEFVRSYALIKAAR